MSQEKHTAANRQEFTVHECSECGRIEGESPQAGCCPGCGRASDAIPVKVRRV